MTLSSINQQTPSNKENRQDWHARCQVIREHLLSNRYSVYPIDLENPYKIARNQDLLAVANISEVALYNLSTGCKLWSCHEAAHGIKQLHVTLRGRVIAQTTFDAVLIFSEGKLIEKCDRMTLNGYLNDPHPSQIALGFHESLSFYQGEFVLRNQWYSVIVTRPAAFVYDLQEKKLQYYELPDEPLLDANLENINLLCLYQNRIVRFQLIDPHWIHREYRLDGFLGPRASLLSNRSCMIVADPEGSHALWCIERSSGCKKRLLTGVTQPPQLSFLGNLLTVCYQDKNDHHFVLINPDCSQVLKRIIHPCNPGESLSFLNGKMVIINESNPSIYIEDFEEEEKVAINSLP